MRVWVALIATSLFCPSLYAADWKSIKPQVTSEAQLIDSFGAPDEVVSTFPWNEWSAKWKKRPKSSHYILRYTVQASKSQLLIGPGGPADVAEVHVFDGRVGAVKWHYGGPSARAAANVLRADPDIKQDRTHSISRAFGRTDHGVISAEIGPDDTQVEVLLQLK